MEKLRVADWLMILAVLLAPLIAVQVQKYLERYREDKDRKLMVFKQLMNSRADLVSLQHVNALNAIDLEFQGKKYRLVTDAWKTCLDHLNNPPAPDDEQRWPGWIDRNVELQAKLLSEMGRSLGYEFDDVHIKRGIYFPQAHGRSAAQDELIRMGLIKILHGEANLKVDIALAPPTGRQSSEEMPSRSRTQRALDETRELKNASPNPEQTQLKNT